MNSFGLFFLTNLCSFGIIFYVFDIRDIILLRNVGGLYLIVGYKGFNLDMTNRYGDKFEVGKTYKACGDISPGNNGNGFHMCVRVEDCFRYVDASSSLIALVKCFGDLVLHEDEYYGYYDMYACEYMEIVRIVPREEIIGMMLLADEFRQRRFVRDFDLTLDERKLFSVKDCDIYGPDYCEGCGGKQLKKCRYNVT